MSYVVRHRATGEYLLRERQWTAQLERALHFNSGMKLVGYLEKTGQSNAAEALEVVPVNEADLPLDHTRPHS